MHIIKYVVSSWKKKGPGAKLLRDRSGRPFFFCSPRICRKLKTFDDDAFSLFPNQERDLSLSVSLSHLYVRGAGPCTHARMHASALARSLQQGQQVFCMLTQKTNSSKVPKHSAKVHYTLHIFMHFTYITHILYIP